MKIAEALNERAILKKKISEIKKRILMSAKSQEGDTPSELPKDLLSEYQICLMNYETLVKAINKANSSTIIPSHGVTLADMLASRDTSLRMSGVISDLCNEASDRVSRYGSSVKVVSNVDIPGLRKTQEAYIKQAQELNTIIQATNWSTDIEI